MKSMKDMPGPDYYYLRDSDITAFSSLALIGRNAHNPSFYEGALSRFNAVEKTLPSLLS